MGKGKGKKSGRKGKGGKATGTQWSGGCGKDGADNNGGKVGKGTKGGKGKGKETRNCHWCKILGHLKEVCLSLLAGKPKTVASLEEDWEED